MTPIYLNPYTWLPGLFKGKETHTQEHYLTPVYRVCQVWLSFIEFPNKTFRGNKNSYIDPTGPCKVSPQQFHWKIIIKPSASFVDEPKITHRSF